MVPILNLYNPWLGCSPYVIYSYDIIHGWAAVLHRPAVHAPRTEHAPDTGYPDCPRYVCLGDAVSQVLVARSNHVHGVSISFPYALNYSLGYPSLRLQPMLRQ